MPHRVGHEHGDLQKPAGVEDELGDEHRPQQRMVKHEGCALADVLERMALRDGRTRWLVDAGEQHDRDGRERRGKAEGRARAPPSHQRAAERGAAGEGDGARELDAGIGRRQEVRTHQRRHQRRGGHAVDDGAAHGGKAEHRQQRQVERADRQQEHDGGERGRAQRLGARHQRAARDAVGEQAGRNREQDEGQGEGSLEQAGLALRDAQRQHRDDGGCGERDLLGRLGREVGPGEAVEGVGKARGI